MFASRIAKASPKTAAEATNERGWSGAPIKPRRLDTVRTATRSHSSPKFHDLSSIPVFAKLVVGDVDDPLEREADRLADHVLRLPPRQSATGHDAIRRTVAQPRRAGVAAGNPPPALVHDVLREPGQPLDRAIRAFAEPRFGHDFSDVRTHTGAQAAASARSLGASAYTVGRNVVFAEGRYAPGTNLGRRLLMHELAHTVQQRAVPELSCSLDAATVQRQAVDKPQPVEPSWTGGEIKAIQTQLVRLGLYSSTIDGQLGDGSKSALVEAFGDETWRTLDAATTVARLTAAKPAAIGKRGEHSFRYGEMFKDGVLDMALAVGFDEFGNNSAAYDSFAAALAAKKFVKDAAAAADLYAKAGRKIGPSAYGDFYVRKDAISYTPPAGPKRTVSAVVRLVASVDGSEGGKVAEAFKDSMANRILRTTADTVAMARARTSIVTSPSICSTRKGWSSRRSPIISCSTKSSTWKARKRAAARRPSSSGA